MFSQIHFVVTTENCGLMHSLHRARYINLLYALITALRHGTHLATAYFSTKICNRAIVCSRMGPKMHDEPFNSADE